MFILCSYIPEQIWYPCYYIIIVITQHPLVITQTQGRGQY